MLKRKLMIGSVAALFIATLIITPASAQVWYDNYFNDQGQVAGESTDSTSPTPTPEQQKTDNPTTGDQQNDDNNTTQTDANKDNGTDLRKNDFKGLQDNKKLTPEQRKSKIEELNKKKKADRCQIIQKNIQIRIDFYQNSHTEHLKIYQRIEAGIQKALDRLKALGYDPSTFDAKIVQLNLMITDFNNLNDELIAQLVEFKNTACSDNKTTPKTQIDNIKNSLAAVREQSKKIQKFIKDDLIKAIKDVIAANKPSVTPSVTKPTTENRK